MKRILTAALLLAGAGMASATDVGVSVSVNQPGVYGRIDIGRVPQPPVLVYPQPVIIAPPPVVVDRAPIYLHVPPGHEKNWRKHCAKYNACGQPVYFVRDDWYQRHYVHAAPPPPPPRHRPDDHGRPGKGPKGPDRWHDDGRGPERDRDRGPGHGRGHGKHGRDD